MSDFIATIIPSLESDLGHWSNFFVYQAKFVSFCTTGMFVDHNF